MKQNGHYQTLVRKMNYFIEPEGVYEEGYSNGYLDAVPYNHWKKDCAWNVMVCDQDDRKAFISVSALTPEEAVRLAIIKYKFHFED